MKSFFHETQQEFDHKTCLRSFYEIPLANNHIPGTQVFPHLFEEMCNLYNMNLQAKNVRV